MNNSFNYLPKQKDSCKIKEITNQNQLRNQKKRLKKLQNKESPTPEDIKNIEILRSNIQEYNNKDIGVPSKNKKEKKIKENLSNDDDIMHEQKRINQGIENYKEKIQQQLKKEYEEKERKIKREYQEKLRKKEREIDDLMRKLRQQERENDYWRQKARKNESNESYKQPEYKKKKSKEEEFFEKFSIEIPDDIRDLFRNYDKVKFKKISLKYHPDKNNDPEYQKIINNIKDLFS